MIKKTPRHLSHALQGAAMQGELENEDEIVVIGSSDPDETIELHSNIMQKKKNLDLHKRIF